MPRIVLARRARRDLQLLDWRLVDKIENTLGWLEREPLSGNALRGRMRGLLCLKVGAYRIIYQLLDGGKTARVVAIRHRAHAYAAIRASRG